MCLQWEKMQHKFVPLLFVSIHAPACALSAGQNVPLQRNYACGALYFEYMNQTTERKTLLILYIQFYLKRWGDLTNVVGHIFKHFMRIYPHGPVNMKWKSSSHIHMYGAENGPLRAQFTATEIIQCRLYIGLLLI